MSWSRRDCSTGRRCRYDARTPLLFRPAADVMPPDARHRLDKNVSPNWRPPAGLADRKPGMPWSDRLWHLLVSLGGLWMVAFGVAVMAFAGRPPGAAR